MKYYTLSALVLVQASAFEILDKKMAFSLFGSADKPNRAARANTGFFEEAGANDFTRECLEEQCDVEECNEAAADAFPELDSEKVWQSLSKNCYLEENKCNARGSAKCIQWWGYRDCECHTFGFKKADGTVESRPAFKAAEDYVSSELFHKKTLGKENTDTGDCAEAVNVCDMYAEDENAGSICEKEHEICQNNVPRPSDSDVSYGSEFPGYVCVCTGGREHNESGECVLPNPCDNSEACPSGSSCIITDEANMQFECVCDDSGYYFSESNQVCEDINECDTQCDASENKVCVNSEGSHSCDCSEGYNSVDSDNVDGFSCEQNNPCADNNCPADATCSNNDLFTYSCSCNDQDSFKYDSLTNTCEAKSCDEVASDLCANNSHCEQHGNNAAMCVCNAGYETDNETSECVDIDECDSQCNSEGQICTNNEGSFECSCASGFEMNPVTGNCDDIDECLSECNSVEYVCTNTVGAFNCDCAQGYKRDHENYCRQEVARRPQKATSDERPNDCEHDLDDEEEPMLDRLNLDSVADDLNSYDDEENNRNDYN